MLRSRKQHVGGGRVKPAALAARILGPRVAQTCQTEWGKSGLPARPVDESYCPFISDGAFPPQSLPVAFLGGK